jgi:hypothetical protein
MLVAEVEIVRGTRAGIVVAVIGCARLAAAQPAPAPASGFDPLDAGGWPRGLTLEDLRALPPCGPEGVGHAAGTIVSCRPAVVRGPVQWGLSIDWTSGAVLGAIGSTGGAHGLGVDLSFALSNRFELTGRYELLGVGGAGGAPAVLANQLFGLLEYRLFTDETGRSAWTLGAGGGFGLRDASLGGDVPVLRASIARELGAYIDDHNALGAALELAYERSLGDMPTDAVLASIRLGFETQIREPADLGEPAPPSIFRHTTSYDVIAGPWLGLGLGLGLRATEHVSLETSGAFLFDVTRDAKLHGFDGASWSLQTGPRLLLPFPEVAPLYLQAQGGAAWVAGDGGGALRPIATGELGIHFFAGCASAVDLGAWVRADVGDGIDVTSGGMVLRLMLGTSAGAAGGAITACDERGAPRLASPPSIDTTPVATAGSTTYTIDTPDVGGAIGGNVDVHAGGSVAVPAPEPVTIEVELGAALYGVQVHVDPRVLPLDRLRGAGWIEVELSGPEAALGSFQAELGAALGRGGVRVDGWARAASDASVVRARFTIWPPGTRPTAR